MRFLFVTWAGGGNSTPVLGLATRLIARGHDVTVVSPDDSTARFAAVGVPYEVLPPDRHPVLAELGRRRPDAVVVDFMVPAWLCDAEASGVPTVALVHTLYDRVAAGIMTAFTNVETINAGRAEVGLGPLADAPDLLQRTTQVLVTSYAELEDPGVVLGPNVEHVGAILEEAGPDGAWEPPRDDGTPLVVASLGTTPGLDDHVVLPKLLDAVAPLPAHVLLNAGAHLDATSMKAADNTTITGYVRHAAVMPHAAAVVTHGGLGVTLAALSHGHPTVAFPLGRDQPHNAARVEALGAGIALTPDASVAEIRVAIERVLDDGVQRDAARRFAAQYDPSASAAIAALEGVT